MKLKIALISLPAHCPLFAAYMERGRDLEEIKRLTSVNWQDYETVRLAEVVVRVTKAVPSVRSIALRTGPPPIVHYEVVVASRNRLTIYGFQHLFDDTDICYVYVFLTNRHEETMKLFTAKVEYLTIRIIKSWHRQATFLSLLPDKI